MLEEKFKKLLGEYIFQITVLQHQMEELQKELNTCKQAQTVVNSSKATKV